MENEKIYIIKNNKRIEAKGEDLDYILEIQAKAQEEEKLFEAEQTAKAEARESAMAKLKALGLTDDEIEALVP